GPEGIRSAKPARFELRAARAVRRRSTIAVPGPSRHFAYQPAPHTDHRRTLVYVVKVYKCGSLDQSEHVVRPWADSTDQLAFFSSFPSQ
ncbi:hypothetical protein M9458_041263, partial [Cirrhinus mrigala]